MSGAPAPRDLARRTADTLALLTTPALDGWVASASSTGAPHLVPLSLAWVDGLILLAVEAASLTARNVAAAGRVRVRAGSTRDVVMIDAVLERAVGVDLDADLGAAYAHQADWDPRGVEGYVFLVLRPIRIQAWRESDEIAGRTVMRDGVWLA